MPVSFPFALTATEMGLSPVIVVLILVSSIVFIVGVVVGSVGVGAQHPIPKRFGNGPQIQFPVEIQPAGVDDAHFSHAAGFRGHLLFLLLLLTPTTPTPTTPTPTTPTTTTTTNTDENSSSSSK